MRFSIVGSGPIFKSLLVSSSAFCFEAVPAMTSFKDSGGGCVRSACVFGRLTIDDYMDITQSLRKLDAVPVLESGLHARKPTHVIIDTIHHYEETERETGRTRVHQEPKFNEGASQDFIYVHPEP